MDGLIAVDWLGVNAVLGCALWRLCRRVFPAESAAKTGMHTLVLFWACVTLSCFALGSVKLLDGLGVFLAGLLLAIAAWGLLRRVDASLQRRKAWDAKHDPAAAKPSQSPASDSTPSSVSGVWDRLMGLGWLAIISLWATYILMEGVMTFPKNWDTLMYHLPLVDHWLQKGSLYVPECPLWHNASNNELMALWIAAPFSGDFLAALNNVPAALLLVLGTLELARQLGLRPPFDHLLAFAVTATHIFYKQILDNENDIAVAGLFFTCMAYGVRYLHRQAAADLVLAATALGLLAGIKYYATGYAVVAWTGLTLGVWLQKGRLAALRTLLAGILGAFVFCGYWYGRNIWLMGTPFFPFGFTSSTNNLHETYPDTWYSTFLGSGRPEVWPLAVAAIGKMAGPCHKLALVTAPVTLGWLIGTGFLLRSRAESKVQGAGRWLLAFRLSATLAD